MTLKNIISIDCKPGKSLSIVKKNFSHCHNSCIFFTIAFSFSQIYLPKHKLLVCIISVNTMKDHFFFRQSRSGKTFFMYVFFAVFKINRNRYVLISQYIQHKLYKKKQNFTNIQLKSGRQSFYLSILNCFIMAH